GVARHDDVRRERHHLSHVSPVSLRISAAEAGDNFDVAALDPSERLKSLPEGREAGSCLRIVADPDEKADAPHPLRLLPSRALHLGRQQQTAATEQCNELTPLAVEHRGLPPLCVISAADWPVRSVFRTSSLP